MSKSANVLSIQTLKDFKLLAMIEFRAKTHLHHSLSGCDMELPAHARLARTRPACLLAIADQSAAKNSSCRRAG